MQRKVRKMEDRLLFYRINCEERMKKKGGHRGSGRLKISAKRLLLEVCVHFEALAANA